MSGPYRCASWAYASHERALFLIRLPDTTLFSSSPTLRLTIMTPAISRQYGGTRSRAALCNANPWLTLRHFIFFIRYATIPCYSWNRSGFVTFTTKKWRLSPPLVSSALFCISALRRGFVRVYSESLLEIFEVSVLAASVTVSLAVDAAPATACDAF